MGILHETGHALGLKHGHEFPLAVSADHDSIEYTVMTYRSYPGGSVEGGYTNEQYGYAQTLMMLDIAALQKIYDHANYTFNSTDSVYTWSPTTGEMSINGVGQGAPGGGIGGSANRIFMTIWDGGGNDTYDFSNYANDGHSISIDLRPGEWTDLDQQLAGLGGGHFARGNIANALLFEGDPRSLIENVIGSAGGERIIANQAANHLTGGGGGDWFTYFATTDSAPGAADTITDFSAAAGDMLNLEGIDANVFSVFNDAFQFIGTSAFHNVAGELRYEVIGGNAHVFGDTNGNGVADLEIILNNVTSLSGPEFFL
jgi:serralysin